MASKAQIKVIRNLLRERRGVEQAITGDRLADIVGLEVRSVRAAIKYLVEVEWEPIAATSGTPYGYFTPANREEAEAYCANLAARSESILKRLKAFSQVVGEKFMLEIREKQLSFFEGENRAPQ